MSSAKMVAILSKGQWVTSGTDVVYQLDTMNGSANWTFAAW